MLPTTFQVRCVTFRVKCDISGECDILGLYTASYHRRHVNMKSKEEKWKRYHLEK